LKSKKRIELSWLRSAVTAALFMTLQMGRSQISPGDLTKFHSELEGMTNCTKCHVLGDKVSNEKCLDCHKELKSRTDQGKGYHVSAEVKGKDCFTCHSEHHGRNFEIVRFDQKKFNHQSTGYQLTGAHRQQECSACHRDENIASTEIKNKNFTYLGLKTNCNSCHRDVHQSTLSTDCATCHNTESFKPATLFDHSKSSFPLKGQHAHVSCNLCHEVTFANGAMFQRFKGIENNSCASCHNDPHKGSFGTKCTDCHNEESFASINTKSTFNHAQTDFPLVGKHKKLNCTSCHHLEANEGPEMAFKDYKNKDFHNCVICHEDVHESKFGTNCKQCHTEESFQKINDPDKFQHNLTGYPLEGKHVAVDCRKCHTGKTTDALPHDLCKDCHQDFHRGQFTTKQISPDCSTCHNVNGFSEATYTIERHQTASFVLTGAHQATPCIACHFINEQWTFRQVGSGCVDCHRDVHEGGLSEKYYPQKDCKQCHTTEAWTRVTFEHSLTGFELTGKHKITSCISCHTPEAGTASQDKKVFIGLNNECSSCHNDQHGGQFNESGITICSKCHGTDQWKPSRFDHNTARFKLDGAHEKVACQKCHQPEPPGDQNPIQYRMGKISCADCHS